ncbi:hypothetical protein MBLNU230_g3107t1 [Neophaeotheca triangularis]
MRFLIASLLLGLFGLAQALSAAGSKLLVVHEDKSDQDKYGMLWHSLKARGYQPTFKTPKDEGLSLFEFGEPAYAHVLLLPTKAKGLGPQLTPNLLVDFINAGGNILLALTAEQAVPSAISNLLLELDISLPADRKSLVVDHINYDVKSSAEKHDVLVVPSPKPSKKGVADLFSVDGPLAVPRAVGQVLGNVSPLLSPILTSPSSAYSYNPTEENEAMEELFAAGSQLSLAAAFQGRNSARFAVVGSAEMLQDDWLQASVQLPGGKAQTVANDEFSRKITAWTFQELGVVRPGAVTHYLAEGAQANSTAVAQMPGHIDTNPSIYRIKNHVHYSIALSNWNAESSSWEPFTTPPGDSVQLEVSMLSPFHRLDLKPTSTTANATIFTAEFDLPDQHGIFNFMVEYRRPLLTNVEEKRTVTVRHFAHDEWPRSFVISGAYPWISGITVTVAGWLGFVALWLYSKPAAVKKDMRARDAKR